MLDATLVPAFESGWQVGAHNSKQYDEKLPGILVSPGSPGGEIPLNAPLLVASASKLAEGLEVVRRVF